MNIITTHLEFGPKARPLIEQMIEAGINPAFFTDNRAAREIPACEQAIATLRKNGLLPDKEARVVCDRMAHKIKAYCQDCCNKYDQSANN